MNAQVQIIVTPRSGDGQAVATARRLREILTQRGVAADLRMFPTLAALERWAETGAPEVTHLVSIGGDATQSAVATAAMRLRVPIVPVPTGFGNLFARAFGHPSTAEDVADLLEQGEIRRVDIGATKNGEIFLSHRSYGALQRIQEAVEERRGEPISRLRRSVAYWMTARRVLHDPRPPSIRVTIDGMLVTADAAIVTVANVETYRGFLTLTPQASPRDGLFDVFILPRRSGFRLDVSLLRLLLGTRGQWNDTRLFRGRRVTVTVGDREPEKLVTRARALRVLVPRGSIARLTRRSQARSQAGERPGRVAPAVERIASSVARPTKIHAA